MGTGDSESVGRALEQGVKTHVGVSVRVRVMAAGAIERSSTGKARRVVDQRFAPAGA